MRSRRRCPAPSRSSRRARTACRSFTHRLAARGALARRADAAVRFVARRCQTFPTSVHDVCERLSRLPPEQIESEADALLARRPAAVDAASAPLLMAALQVYWVDLASRLAAEDVADLDVPGVCPVCGTPARRQHRARRPTISGLSLSALRPVRDGMAHGARDLQPLPGAPRASPTVRSKAAPRPFAPSAATIAAPTARFSIRKKTTASSRWRTISRAWRSTCW